MQDDGLVRHVGVVAASMSTHHVYLFEFIYNCGSIVRQEDITTGYGKYSQCECSASHAVRDGDSSDEWLPATH